MAEIDFKKLAEPFAAEDIEWRLQSCGKTRDGKFYGKCLAYITNRAIQQRLDDVVGPDNWKNEYVTGPNGGILCGLSIRCNGEFITKWDGAENTQVEAVKGGLSDSMKRAAVQWGMGRYLYKLDEGWAETSTNEKPSKDYPLMGSTKDKEKFTWRPPRLPNWALPNGNKSDDTPKMSPAAEKERANELSKNPEYIQLKTELDQFLNADFIASESKDKIRTTINNFDISKMKAQLAWCKKEQSKAGVA